MFFKQDSGKPEPASRRTLPALPLRDIIVFPHMSSRLFVGREKSIAALEEAMLDIMYDVPSKQGIKEVVINDDVITKSEQPLIVYHKEAELA